MYSPPDLAFKLYDRRAKCLLPFKRMVEAEAAYKLALQYLDKAKKLPEEKKKKTQKDILQVSNVEQII